MARAREEGRRGGSARGAGRGTRRIKMAMSLIQACRSLALSTWLLSFCFVHLLCLDFTVAEKEEWYTAFVNITYAEPAPDPGAGAAGGGGGGGSAAELHTEKTECGRYGEHSPKQDARGEVVMASSAHDRLACDPNTKFAAPAHGKNWIALIPKGNCTYRDKIRNAFLQNASAVVIFNVGSNTNETITMSHAGRRLGGRGAGEGSPRRMETPRRTQRPPLPPSSFLESLCFAKAAFLFLEPTKFCYVLLRGVSKEWANCMGCGEEVFHFASCHSDQAWPRGAGLTFPSPIWKVGDGGQSSVVVLGQ